MAAGFQFVNYGSQHVGLELDVHLVVKRQRGASEAAWGFDGSP